MNQKTTYTLLILAALPNWIMGGIVFLWAVFLWLISKHLWRNKTATDSTWQWILSYDQHANALAFGNRDEYISTRAGRCARKGGNRPCIWLCKLLNAIDKSNEGHCEKSIQKDAQEAEEQTK